MKVNVKTILGVGVIAVVGIYLFKKFRGDGGDELDFDGSGRFVESKRSRGRSIMRNINDASGCSRGGILRGYNDGYSIYESKSGQAGWACKAGERFSLQQAGLK